MKKYPKNFTEKIKNFLQLDFKIKFKKFLTLVGLKFFLYNSLFFIVKLINKNRSPFVRGILFDALKYKSKLEIVENKHKEKFIIFTNDNVISKEIFVSEEFDIKKVYKALDFLNKKSKISRLYDIGANIGVICIPAVKRGLVESANAVEPERKNFELLQMNVALNDLQNKIKIFDYALSDKDNEIIEMELAEDNSGDHRIKNKPQFNIHGEENRKTVKVNSKKFDSLFTNIDPKKDLVWIDTQGYEPIILSGSENLIKSKTPIVIEFWPYALKRAGHWEKMMHIFSKFDYFIDLSLSRTIPVEINEKNLLILKDGWDSEKKGDFTLYTDLILLKN
jgi:FkbM family methyltransferase